MPSVASLLQQTSYARCRQRKTREGRQFGASLLLVGAVATAYHSTEGQLRSWLRKADYWSISLATSTLLRAVCPHESQVSTSLHHNLYRVVGYSAVSRLMHTEVSACYTILLQVRAQQTSPVLLLCPKLTTRLKRTRARRAWLKNSTGCTGLTEASSTGMHCSERQSTAAQAW